MKVLWFTNTPCSAAELLKADSHRGGWLKGWEAELVRHNVVELHIAFYFNRDIAPFTHLKTRYHPVYRKNTSSKAGRWLKRLTGGNRRDNKEVKLLLGVVTAVQPDLIHVHGSEDNFGLVAGYTDIPVVMGIQGILSPYAEKYFSGIPRQIAGRYEGILPALLAKSSAQLFRDFSSRAARERRMLQGAKYVIGRTNWDNRVARMLAPQAQYFYCDDILRSGFYNNTWQKDVFNKRLRLVSVSSEALYKGFEMIVQTAALLAARKDFEFEWIVLGLDKSHGSVNIVKNWLKHDLDDLSIELRGSGGEEEIIRVLLDCDIYCQVSHIENSPNSLCEAMLLGMPVIASYAGGTGSLVTDRQDGLMVQDGDPYALAGAILEMASEEEQAKEYARKARIRALDHHDKERIGNDLLKIYETILTKNK